MNKREYLDNISIMIEKLSKENMDNEIKIVKDMVSYRKDHSTPDLQSLTDIYYFLCGIMFSKGLSDYWNGREVKLKKSVEEKKE